HAERGNRLPCYPGATQKQRASLLRPFAFDSTMSNPGWSYFASGRGFASSTASAGVTLFPFTMMVILPEWFCTSTFFPDLRRREMASLTSCVSWLLTSIASFLLRPHSIDQGHVDGNNPVARSMPFSIGIP